MGQVGVTSLLVLYLFSERDWSATSAAVALGLVQLGGAGARIAVGRWSDQRDARIEPFRRLALVAGVLLLSAAALAGAPSALLVPVLMAGGVFAMSWNGLSFTAAAEISGGAQAGRAMGIQNTLMRVAARACRSGWARSRRRVLAAHLLRDGPGAAGRGRAARAAGRGRGPPPQRASRTPGRRARPSA